MTEVEAIARDLDHVRLAELGDGLIELPEDTTSVEPGARASLPMRWVVAEKLPLLALTVASCIVTLWAQNEGEAVVTLEYLPLTTAGMRRAAELWAHARQQGQPTAGDNTIDGDRILAAQALTLGTPDVVSAATNVGHLARFVAAELWQNVLP